MRFLRLRDKILKSTGDGIIKGDDVDEEASAGPQTPASGKKRKTATGTSKSKGKGKGKGRGKGIFLQMIGGRVFANQSQLP